MTSNGLSLREKTALSVKQQALLLLGQWSEAQLPQQIKPDFNNTAITKAKSLLNWTEKGSIQPLRLLFDKISLQQTINNQYHTQPKAISNELPPVPYPIGTFPDLNEYKREVKQAIESLSINDWNNSSFLSIFLEKYGSSISFTENDIAFWDIVKTTSAVASILTDKPQEAEELSLIAGDLSGIQDFIYTISADGALRSLRARSFYLELVTEEITQQLLERLDLPRSCVIYVGGGNIYILAPSNEIVKQVIETLRNEINQWLLQAFQGKVYLTLASCHFPIEDIGSQSFATHWQDAVQKLAKQKEQKFANQINQLLAVQNSYEPCQVCYRDMSKT